jgi:hypothetical protein
VQSDWTPHTLFIHFTQRFEDNDTKVKAALDANEKRLDGLNEVRQTLQDRDQTFLPRAEFEVAHQALIERIEAKSQRAWATVLPIVVGAAGIVTALIIGLKH